MTAEHSNFRPEDEIRGVLESYVQNFGNDLLTSLYYTLENLTDAELITEQTFVEAIGPLGGIGRSQLTFQELYRIALQKVREQRSDLHGQDVEFWQSRYSHDLEKVLRDLGKLSEEQRAILVLRELQNLNYEEIAVAMNTTAHEVRGLLAKARRAFLDIQKERR